MMAELTQSALWPYLFVLLAASLPTMIWRWLGVLAAGNLREDSQWLLLVRCIATGLVAGVIGQFIFTPTGALAEFPLFVRAGAALIGFLAFYLSGRKVIICILAAETVLLIGAYLSGV